MMFKIALGNITASRLVLYTCMISGANPALIKFNNAVND